MSFGYKTAWFAVRSANADAVVKALRLMNPVPAKAEFAIEAAYRDVSPGLSGKAFVTPPLGGWMLVMSTGFFDFAGEEPAQFPHALSKLSAELGAEVQFFATHRGVEGHLWARAMGGQLVLAYSYFGESGEKKVDIGEPTAEELALGFRFFDPSSPDAEAEGYWAREDLRHPDEEDVMRLAERWSVNPSVLDEMPDGFLADLPPRSPTIRAPQSSPAPRKPWWRFW